MNIYEKLNKIQVELKAPKSQRNNFGNYNYRSCEDILEAVKPLLEKYQVVLTINDEIELIGNRYYIKATAKLYNTDKEGELISTSAYAREEENKKGMDASQLTGSTSSYARKYALNGLFSIDDTKDSDATNTHGNTNYQQQSPNSSHVPLNASKGQKKLTAKQITRLYALAYNAGYNKDKIEEMVQKKFNKEIDNLSKSEYDNVCDGLQAKIDTAN